MDKLLLTYREAAMLLGVCERKLADMVKRREIPCVRIKRSVRFRREALCRWVEQLEQQGAA